MTHNGLCTIPDCWAQAHRFTLCYAHYRDPVAPVVVPKPVLHCCCPEGTPCRRNMFGGTQCDVCFRPVLPSVRGASVPDTAEEVAS